MEIAGNLSRFPPIDRGDGDVRMSETPCVVLSRPTSDYSSLYRAVPVQYDARTRRYSYEMIQAVLKKTERRFFFLFSYCISVNNSSLQNLSFLGRFWLV